MAQTYEQWKQSYESMDKAQKQQYADLLKTKGSDYIGNQYANRYASEMWSTPKTSTTTSTPTTSTASTSTWNQWSSSNYKDSDWYYSGTDRNAATAGSEFGWTTTSWATTTKVETPKVETPKVETPSKTTASSDLASFWNNLSYEDQQKYLNQNPNLKQSVVAKWLTIKSQPTQETPKTEGETPKQWEWDYQDNSPERMKQIADNVDSFAITNPDLFTSEDAFRNFFIDWKGRTPEQEKFLMDYYKNRKMYNQLDNYTSNDIGNMLAWGKIPDSYITYLKYSDPQRYAEVMDAKAKAEDKIKDEAALDTINSMNGEGGDTSTSKVIEWLKANWLLVDKDWNLVDDRRENYASEEEKTYLKQLADLAARNLEIDNIVKHSYDDYVKAYPWATKATLMAMAQDANADLLREKENNLVEMTRLQWYVDYMQDERFEMNAAWADTIAQLQKDYGMYYQYSPQWMSELAQAQYAATNVTLDQADKWTYTQKQMALESVLAPIYQQYWSIIQRPMAQVINDVIAYAQNKWISLSKALEENFMTPLKSKPAYTQLSSAEPYTVKVWDVLYQYDYNTWEFTPVNTSVIWTATGLWTMRTERNNNPTAMITAYAKQLWGVEWVDYEIWDSFTSTDENWVTHTYYTAKLIGDPIDKTIELLDRWVANNVKQNVFSAWSYAKDLWMTNEKWKNMSREEKEALILKMLQHEWWDITKMAYYNQWDTASVSNQNAKFWWLDWWNNNWYSENLVEEYKSYIKDPSKFDKSDVETKLSPLWMTFYDFTTQAQNYTRTWLKVESVEGAAQSLEAALKLYEYIAWDEAQWAWWLNSAQWWPFDTLVAKRRKGTKAHDAYNYYTTLTSRLTLDELIKTKKQWATYWAMSEWEWKLLQSAATDLDWSNSSSKFRENLEDLIYSLVQTVQWWEWQMPLNYQTSSARDMIEKEDARWRWDIYKNDNTPFIEVETSVNEKWPAPSEI